MGRAPDGRGSPLSGRSSCASPGGRPIGAAEPKDGLTDRPLSPAQPGIMTVPKEMPEKWARAGAPPSWSRKKPTWGTGNGRQRQAALPSPELPLSYPHIRVSSASPNLPRTSPFQTQRSWLRRVPPLTLSLHDWAGVSARGLPSGEVSGSEGSALVRQRRQRRQVLLLQCALQGSSEGVRGGVGNAFASRPGLRHCVGRLTRMGPSSACGHGDLGRRA